MKLKYFTLEQAETLLPEITVRYNEALEIKVQIELKVDEWRKVHEKIAEADEAILRGQVDFLASRLEQKLTQVSDLGAVPKDLDMGLVDFPARIDGSEAYLCWKLGEPKIGYWHKLTDGFPGRKPLLKSTTVGVSTKSKISKKEEK